MLQEVCRIAFQIFDTQSHLFGNDTDTTTDVSHILV